MFIASAFATVYNWVNEFKRGRTSICDASRSECPIEATLEIHLCEVDISFFKKWNFGHNSEYTPKNSEVLAQN